MFVAEKRDEILAAAVCLPFRDTVDLLYGASDERRLELHPNHALYAEIVRWSIERGYRVFDLGGGRPSLASFKSRWAAEPVEMFNYNYRVKDDRPADRLRQTQRTASTGANPRLARLWDTAPLFATRVVGEGIRRYL